MVDSCENDIHAYSENIALWDQRRQKIFLSKWGWSLIYSTRYWRLRYYQLSLVLISYFLSKTLNSSLILTIRMQEDLYLNKQMTAYVHAHMCKMIKMMLRSTHILHSNDGSNELKNIIWNSKVNRIGVTVLIWSHPAFKTKIIQNLCLFTVKWEKYHVPFWEMCIHSSRSNRIKYVNEKHNEKKKNKLEILVWFSSTAHQHFVKYWNTYLTPGTGLSLLQGGGGSGQISTRQ